MNLKTLIIAGIILTANHAKANILQINETKEELTRITAVKAEAKVTLDKAKLAYKALQQAEKQQKRALRALQQADLAKQKAQKNSITSTNDTGSTYYADISHGYGEVKLIK